MKSYLVGGCVRDKLLGLPQQDRDHVVVGASAEQMEALGYKPVGKDFPVFLHPQTHEEYALARTERKSGHGYRGFTVYAAPDVTLEQDLARRDLTLNAIAEDHDGRLIDPFGGQRDIEAGILRHVSAAFAEDPVRILRLARFVARFGFRVAPETMALCRQMVDQGEVDHLVPERVWQEVAKGLQERRPSPMFRTLRECGALARLLPELAQHFDSAGERALRVLDAVAQAQASLEIRFAVLVSALPSVAAMETLSQRLRAPNDCRDLAVMGWREREAIAAAESLDGAAVLDLLLRCDALRKPARFADLLRVCGALATDGGHDYHPADWLVRRLAAVAAVDGGAIARTCAAPADIPAAVRAARLAAIEQLED
ncbi:multifunctional CCA tRNA nucleotidyl transferase/2'3'-cyclic phosphodiesterase/2'nucleotidase/phosphatase [Chitinimonas lacunae]|uniref:Multifunctional CCA tRNA nucleotidyl transferase/2'3'-cyclic phosphodiesterase/2'nucleotidase/phosphatase n=1 Tax=Chitinimonas lacunae TaxID=1963018 RepID=A0ABV8MV59_9NEIS